ncbi:MAG: MarR family transcriptional regulator [Proteobacteria bacterium]|nr:MarR family transcriptional regulator [Pseudomonadota bacterium]
MVKHPGRKSIGFQLMLAARLHRTRMAILLDEIGLFPGQEQALQVLAQNQAGMTMGELSRALHVRPPTTSKTIARLAAQELVERDSTAGDGRVVRARLTAAGLEKLARIDAATAQIEGEINELFDSKDAKRLRKSLRRIARKLGEMVDPSGNHDALIDEENEDEE